MKKTNKESCSEYSAAIVCSHIVIKKMPILMAKRDYPQMEEDSGWQFLCCSGEEETEAQVWALKEVFEVEPSLKFLIEMPVGSVFRREDCNSQWIQLY